MKKSPHGKGTSARHWLHSATGPASVTGFAFHLPTGHHELSQQEFTGPSVLERRIFRRLDLFLPVCHWLEQGRTARLMNTNKSFPAKSQDHQSCAGCALNFPVR
jgi:hypothetical protein